MKSIVTTILCGFLFGAQVSLENAGKVAHSIFVERAEIHNTVDFEVTNIETIKSGEQNLIFIFHLNPEGFIMVPADDQAVPALAFGFDHPFTSANLPSNLAYQMDIYQTELINLVNSQNAPAPEIQEQWNKYMSGDIEESRSRDVNPLIAAEFDQSGGWNNGVTSGIGFNGPVGCVAVAMCQVMHYWKYPEQGQGSNYYWENDFGYIEVDFEDAYYDFNNMAATYATNASQLLLFHAGVSVNMDYDYSGSGAWVVGPYPSAFYSMENFFRYSSDISYMWKDNYSTDEYRNILKDELNQNRPIIYQGYDNSGYGGHAWNIDGYSGNNLHCNWGWGGWNNGYYNLNTMGGFPNDQAAVIGIYPQMEAPMALFEYDVEDLTVTFIDLSEIVNEVEIGSWLWDFGDGNTSTFSMPVHTYQSSAVYEVSLVVSNIYGQESEPYIEFIQVGSAMAGDVNNDSILNILDIVILVNFILGNDTPDSTEFSAADLNGDGVLNILDIVSLANLILDA